MSGREGRNRKRRRITERVQFKFVLSFFLLVTGLIVLLNTLPIAASRDLVFKEKESSLLGQAAVVSSSLSGLDRMTPDSVGQVMDLLELSSSSRFLVTDAAGLVLYDSDQPAFEGRYALLREVQYALNGKRYGFIFIVDNPAHFQRRYAVNFSRGGVRAFSNHLF